MKYIWSKLVMATILIMVGLDVSNAQDSKSCWNPAERVTTYNYCTNATADLVKSKCTGINLYDDEIFSDFLSCGGATVCWLQSEYPPTDSANVEMSLMLPVFILESSHNLQLTDDQITTAKANGTSLLLGKEICVPLQKALDKFMPQAVKALR